MKLSPSERKVYDYLKDGEYHCMANPDFFMKDDRARISGLQRKGIEIESVTCDGRCGISHHARILMRKLKNPPKRQLIEYTDEGTVRVTYA